MERTAGATPEKGGADFKISGLVSFCGRSQCHWMGESGGTGDWRRGREGYEGQAKWFIRMNSGVVKNDGMTWDGEEENESRGDLRE